MRYTARAVANVALLLFCLAAGVWLRARGRVEAGAHVVLVRVVVDLALPALTFMAIRGYRADAGARGALLMVLTPWLVFAVVGALVLAAARARRWPRAVLGSVLVTATVGNTAFMGVPMVETLVGRDGVGPAVLLDQAGSFVIVSTASVLLASHFAARAGGEAKPRLTTTLRRVLRFAPLWGSLAGALSRGHALPAWFEALLARLALLVVPLALMAVGMQLRLDRALLRRQGARIGYVLAAKLVAAPLVVLAVARVVDVRGPSLHAAVLQNAMAPMVTAGMVATEYGLEPELSASLVAFGAVASFLTIPLWEYALRALGL